MKHVDSDVLVTGTGVVSSVAAGTDRFAAALFEGRSGVHRKYFPTGVAPQETGDGPEPVGAWLEGFSLEAGLEGIPALPVSLAAAALTVARRSPLSVQTSVVAALEAWIAARLHERALPPERIGLVISGHNTTRGYQHSLVTSFQNNPSWLNPRYALQHLDSDQLGVLSQVLGIRGEGLVAGGASASGNVGLIQAMRMVRAGVVDVCLVVGVLADLSPMEWQGFHAIGALGARRFATEPARASRPFDAANEGFVPGQAAASIVLESQDAGGKALARLLGGAIVLHGTAGPEPDVTGEVRAMHAALRDAGVDSRQIDYINAHGSGSPLGDRIEIEAIDQVLQGRINEVWINATKGLIGHCLSSAGVVEAIATVAQIRGGFVHPNVNLDAPIHPTARFCGPVAATSALRTAISNSFGFGGINTAIVLGEALSPGSDDKPE